MPSRICSTYSGRDGNQATPRAVYCPTGPANSRSSTSQVSEPLAAISPQSPCKYPAWITAAYKAWDLYLPATQNNGERVPDNARIVSDLPNGMTCRFRSHLVQHSESSTSANAWQMIASP